MWSRSTTARNSSHVLASARPSDAAVEYHVVDAAYAEVLLSLGSNRFNKAVCTMAVMDMPEIGPLFATLSRMLAPGGAFVFSVTHPIFFQMPSSAGSMNPLFQ